MTEDQIIEIYKLTYIYQMFEIYRKEKGGVIPETKIYMVYEKTKEELENLLLDAMIVLIEDIAMWIHDMVYFNEMPGTHITLMYDDDMNKMVDHTLEISKSNINKTVADVDNRLRESTMLDAGLNKKEQHNFKQVLLSFPAILKSRESEDLSDMIIQFQVAINLVHYGGTFLQDLLRFEGERPEPEEIQHLLDYLSSDKATKDFNDELKNMVGPRAFKRIFEQ